MSVRKIFGLLGVLALAGCMGSSSGEAIDVGSENKQTPVVIEEKLPVRDEPSRAVDVPMGSADALDPKATKPIVPGDLEIVADEMSYFDYIPVDVIPAAASDVDAIIYSRSGIILLPRSLVTNQLNDLGAIRNLLLQQLGADFPQAASWTFRVLTNDDYIPRVLRRQFGFYLPDWSPYSLIVVGDESAFLDQLFDEFFGEPFEPDTGTYDIIPSIITSSVSAVTATATSGSY